MSSTSSQTRTLDLHWMRQPNTGAVLPPEIIHLIFQALTKPANGLTSFAPVATLKPDIETLSSCSLVCAAWRDISAGYLFSSLTIVFGMKVTPTNVETGVARLTAYSPNRGETLPLIEFLDESPRVRNAVLDLHIISCLESVSDNCNVAWRDIDHLLSLFPHVSTLILSGTAPLALAYDICAPDSPADLPQHLRRLTLRSASLEDMLGPPPTSDSEGHPYTLSSIYELISQFRSVEELILEEVDLQTFAWPLPETHTYPCRVNKVAVHFPSMIPHDFRTRYLSAVSRFLGGSELIAPVRLLQIGPLAWDTVTTSPDHAWFNYFPPELPLLVTDISLLGAVEETGQQPAWSLSLQRFTNLQKLTIIYPIWYNHSGARGSNRVVAALAGANISLACLDFILLVPVTLEQLSTYLATSRSGVWLASNFNPCDSQR